MARRRKPPYRDGQIHVCAKQCDTCIFWPGNRMELQPGRVEGMVATALRLDTAIICHETLDGDRAICRGFFNRHQRDVLPLRLALMLGNIREVDANGNL